MAQAPDILARRWTLLVIRELLSGSHHFNDLHRGVPRMSRSLLVRRLNELEEAGLVERRLVGADDHPEYHLTQAGEELQPIIFQLGSWGKRWVQREVSREELDAGLLMWDMQRRIVRDRLPPQRIVVYFQFTDAPKEHQHFWLILEQDEVDLCLKDPGGEEDLYVRSDVRTLTDVWLGDISLTRALKEESLWLGGSPSLRRSFPDWLGLSMFAGIARQPRGKVQAFRPRVTSA
ncbi:MAG: winged helix-turn-helix transcriptional regulator [Rhodothermales bacterium]